MKMKPLTEFCALNMGQSPSSETYNDENVGLPFFQGNADFGEVHPKVRIWCSSPVKVAAAGDILISVRAPIGAMNIANTPCCIGRGLAALSPNPGTCVQEYLYYALQSRIDSLIAQGTGSTFKAIGKKTLEDTQIPAYSLDEQQIISDTLSETDQLITKTKAQVSLLDQLVKSRFVEMFGEPVTNSKGYPIHQLSDHILFLTSGSRGWAQYYTDKGEWFITIKNVKDCRISVDDVQCINPPKNAEAERTRLREGDLLISITADLGRTGVVTKEIAEHGAYNNQHLTCIRLDRLALDPLYVAFFMESEAGKRQFEAKNMSAVKAGLNFDSIRSLRLIVPPLTLQKEFTAFVAEVDKSKFRIQKSLSTSRKLWTMAQIDAIMNMDFSTQRSL